MPTAAEIQADYAPRIAAAAARDAARRAEAAENRDAALIDVPCWICGLQVRRMTLDDYLTLSVLGNAYISAVPVPEDPRELAAFWPSHQAQFLWWLSPDFSSSARDREAFTIYKVAPLNFAALDQAIGDYLREMFADAPKTSSPAQPRPNQAPAHSFRVSFAVHWIARIARRFHWSRAEIRSLPLPELFQYLNFIAAEKLLEDGGRLPASLDGEADRLWAEMLAQINALHA